MWMGKLLWIYSRDTKFLELSKRLVNVDFKIDHLSRKIMTSSVQMSEPVDDGVLQTSDTKLHAVLTNVCQYCYRKQRLSEEEIAKRHDIADSLQAYLRTFFSKHVIVRPFGSTVNGFGSHNSDLDLYVFGISKLSLLLLLQKYHLFSNISSLGGRIPLVKFCHTESGINGDISFSNSIAEANSKLLHRYSEINEACLFLVYAMKHLVKQCNIVEVYNHFLSSYTYTLMVLYFLQQLPKPLLPVLQEVVPPHMTRSDVAKYRINGYLTYYFTEDNDSLKQLWLDSDTNNQSVGELLINLMDFYANKFDYFNDIVCIRRKVPDQYALNLLRRKHYASQLMVQDPFEIHRNLTNNLLPVSSTIIRNVFSRAHQHFSNLPKRNFTVEEYMEYFFDPHVLLGDDYGHLHKFRSNRS